MYRNFRLLSCLVELLFDYKIKGLLKRFVIVYSVTEFKRKVFVLSVKVLSP